MSTVIQDHLDFLNEKIFQTEKKWPHFKGMLNDIKKIAQDINEDDEVAILERSYIYGGSSLFAPLFTNGNLNLIDCQTLTAAERGGYQANWTDDDRCIKIASQYKAPITSTELPSNSQDYIIIPNVVHHVRDQDAMFKEFERILKPGGRGYIFEALVRELHQKPDDYIRYTPWGFEYMFEKSGLKMKEFTPVGGPFEAISYCWIQAVQYLPEEKRKEMETWFYGEEFQRLLKLDGENPENQFRKHTSFPMAYGIFFEK